MNRRAVGSWFAALALGVVLLSVSAQTAQAVATRTWTGLGASNNWSDAANWDTGVPVAGDTIVFPGTAQRKTNTNNLAANTSFFRIRFDGPGYDISGNALELTEDLRNQPPSGANIVRLDIGGAAEVIQDSGKLTLGGENTFDGDVFVHAGVLVVLSDTALGGEPGITIVDDGATVQLTGALDLGSEALSLHGDGFDGLGALQSFNGTNIAPDVFVGSPTTIGVGNSVLVFESLQASAGAELTLVGGGKLQVDSMPVGGFPGAIHVIEGNLTWNAGSAPYPAVDVQRFGILRGIGTVGSVTVTSGVAWPGSGNLPGVLTVVGATQYNSGFLKVDLDGPDAGVGYGQLATNGIALNAVATALDLDLGFTPEVGMVFRIIDNAGGGPVQGTFLDLPEGTIFAAGGMAFHISYVGGTGNDVTLTVVRRVSADLELTMEAAPTPVAPGGTLVYTVEVVNQGPDPAASPTVFMGTPVGTTFDSATAPAGWSCSKLSTSPNVQCSGPNLAVGASATFTLRFKVNSGVAGEITGTATVSSQTNDQNSVNNGATVATSTGQGGGLPFRRVVVGLAADS